MSEQVRHKCFLSYHHADEGAVTGFMDEFGGAFIRRGISMPGDVIDSDNTDYVMRRIRELYLQDSTVTIVLIGRCTWARRFVDWEVQASLRRPRNGPPPNGLIAIQLWKSYASLPERVNRNVESGYANFYEYPANTRALASMVDEAFNARTGRPQVIDNPRDRYRHNRSC